MPVLELLPSRARSGTTRDTYLRAVSKVTAAAARHGLGQIADRFIARAGF